MKEIFCFSPPPPSLHCYTCIQTNRIFSIKTKRNKKLLLLYSNEIFFFVVVVVVVFLTFQQNSSLKANAFAQLTKPLLCVEIELKTKLFLFEN